MLNQLSQSIFMRQALTVLFVFLSLATFAQKYSSVIEDTAISNFMGWLFQSDTAFKDVRHVDNDIIELHSTNFIYADSVTLINHLYAENIFRKENNLSKYFTQDDANYFVKQIQSQRKNKWQLKFKNIKLYDEIQLIDNHVDKALYSYSLPLFSMNKRYVIIIEAMYCGLVCGGGDYNMYERQSDNSWKKIKQLNHWDE